MINFRRITVLAIFFTVYLDNCNGRSIYRENRLLTEVNKTNIVATPWVFLGIEEGVTTSGETKEKATPWEPRDDLEVRATPWELSRIKGEEGPRATPWGRTEKTTFSQER